MLILSRFIIISDYAGRWKILQYFVQDFFAPVIIFGHVDPKMTLSVNVASDLQVPFKDAEALIQVHRWDSFEPIGNITVGLDMVKKCCLMKNIFN